MLRDEGRRRLGSDEQVNVIGHHDECDQVVTRASPFAIPDDLGNKFGDLRQPEPGGAGGRPIEFPVGRSEGSPIAPAREGQCTVQTKGDEKFSLLRLEVRQVATILHAGKVGAGARFLRLVTG